MGRHAGFRIDGRDGIERVGVGRLLHSEPDDPVQHQSLGDAGGREGARAGHGCSVESQPFPQFLRRRFDQACVSTRLAPLHQRTRGHFTIDGARPLSRPCGAIGEFLLGCHDAVPVQPLPPS